jgi:AcrR family transcriptional regulator
VETRQLILLRAIKLFNERGVNHVGVREIARDLNLSPGNLSYHFKKKEDLLKEILENYSAINTDLRSRFRSGSSDFTAFMQMMLGIFENQYAHRGVLSEIVEVNRLLHQVDAEVLSTGQNERISEFRSLLQVLQSSGSLVQNMDVLEEVLGLLTLYGRFWVAEAFLNAAKNRQEWAPKYALQLAQILRHYATEKGLIELNDFVSEQRRSLTT